MEFYFRKYFWVTRLVVIAICAFFAAKAVGQLVGAGIVAPQPRLARSPAGVVGAPTLPPVDLEAIKVRNIFCSTCEPPGTVEPVAEAVGSAEPSSAEPVRSSLNLKLLATLVGDQLAPSYAALLDLTTSRVQMLTVGDELPGGARLNDVMPRRVYLQNGAQQEYIDLEESPGEAGQISSAATPPPSRAPLQAQPKDEFADKLAQGVRKIGANKWELQRSALDSVLGNTTLLARSARVVPSVRNGQPEGFKLFAIRPGSIYSLIGMENGDTIHAINGQSMNTPDKALEVYTKVRNASHLSISFSRRGTPMTHDYVIR